jgi:hypothetical protein
VLVTDRHEKPVKYEKDCGSSASKFRTDSKDTSKEQPEENNATDSN